MKNRYIQIFPFLIALLLFATPPACELDDEINFGKSNTTEKDPDDKQELTLDTIGWNIPTEAITVAQAREICMALESGSNTGSKYYVMGYVKKLHYNHASGITGYGNAQFYIEDVKGANSRDDFLAYQVYGPDSKKLTNPNEVAVGDFVVIYGALTNYNGTYETVGKGAAYIWKSTNPLLNLPLDNAHKYVDLGLSVKWATCNVGAESPEDYGDYFAWGETQPKSTYNWSTYKWCNGSSSTLTKYNTSSSYGTVDNKTVLEAADDAATANWGGAWRMPTKAEQDELREQCTWTWTTQNDVKGYKVTSKSNGNSIFLPAAGYRDVGSRDYVGSFGYYWSSTLVTDNPNDAYYLYFNSGNVDWYINYRYFGLSVRPVLGENKVAETTVPTVTTAAITQITETTAVAGGNVTSDGGAEITERGVVYATTQNPTTNNTKVMSGTGTGSFTCNLTDLQPNTTYYVRAYAINETGTAYGEEVTFTPKKLILETMYVMPPTIEYKPLGKGKQMTWDGEKFVAYDLGYPKSIECLLAVVGTKFGRVDWEQPVLGILNGKLSLITEEQFKAGEATSIQLANDNLESIDTITFDPLTFELYFSGKVAQPVSALDVNADLAEVAGKNYRHAKIFFDPAIEVTISGVANIATAHNLDYMEVVNSNVVKFLGEKGMYEVYYLPTEDYIVVEPLKDAVYPNVMWMTGVGFGLPVAEPKTQGGWGFDNLGQYIACRTVAPKVYQFTAYLKNGVNADFATYGSLVFKFFHQKGWGGEESGGNYEQIGLPIQGVGPEGLTKLNGDTGAEAGNWIAATQEKFEGIYRITLDQNKFTTTYEKIR